ncbi:hypothetical protein NLI96_g868 [Meripilus lineatus]|uniref:Uncharacterized protein n=1 Tax=Meripilus lineatus TaxID=2056292 RepID=A0AAD5YIX2_9APHY|nr:hypothetical protein NLI96_g868 [Physisporinus lineatus]
MNHGTHQKQRCPPPLPPTTPTTSSTSTNAGMLDLEHESILSSVLPTTTPSTCLFRSVPSKRETCEGISVAFEGGRLTYSSTVLIPPPPTCHHTSSYLRESEQVGEEGRDGGGRGERATRIGHVDWATREACLYSKMANLEDEGDDRASSLNAERHCGVNDDRYSEVLGITRNDSTLL